MVVEYANYLTSQGHDVVIMANIVDTIFTVKAKINPISHSNKSKIKTIMSALFLKNSFDVIIADIIVMTFLLAVRNRICLLYFAQDYDESYYKNPLMKILIRAVYFYSLRILAIPVIAVSEELGQLLKRRFNANVSIVPNGVDTDIFYPDRDEEYLVLKGSGKVILVFARSDYRKGFDLAVKVLAGFSKKIEDGIISVWAVGEDIEVPFKMRYFGFVPPEKLRKILSCSDVLLYPSRHEGLPLFVLEAMACGCPVVTTKTVGFVIDGKNGLIADTAPQFGEKLITVLKNSQEGEYIKHQGFEAAKRYNLHSSKRSFEKTLQETFKDTE
jgi:glycosyltransferase involved in cell wall biosynthesis